MHSLKSAPDIICLSETWLKDCNDHNSYRLKGSNTITNKSRKGLGGGVMMQLKVNVTVIEEFASELAESISVLAKVNNEVFGMMLVYNPPKDNKFAFVEEFEKVL